MVTYNEISSDNSTPGNKLFVHGALWLNKFKIFFDHRFSVIENNVTFESVEEVIDSHDLDKEEHVEKDCVDSPSCPKKRKHAESRLWTKNICKHNRGVGKSYINTRVVVVPAKEIQDHYHCDCRNDCSSKISFDQRLLNFKQFYEYASWEMQKILMFLSSTRFEKEIGRASAFLWSNQYGIVASKWAQHFSCEV